jgi:hypothetical protein
MNIPLKSDNERIRPSAIEAGAKEAATIDLRVKAWIVNYKQSLIFNSQGLTLYIFS